MSTSPVPGSQLEYEKQSKLEPEAWVGNSGAAYSCLLCAQTLEPEKVLQLTFHLNKNIAAKHFSWMVDF